MVEVGRINHANFASRGSVDSLVRKDKISTQGG